MGVVSQCFAGATTASLTKLLSMIARRNFRYSQTRALSFLAINCKMEPQKHATRFDLRYDIYSGLWCHKPMKELGFECDFVKLVPLHRGFDRLVVLSEDVKALKQNRILPPDCRKQPV